jgi:RNA polymerase sigma-19 factor, ECF subfamily
LSEAIIFKLRHSTFPMDNETAGANLIKADSAAIFESVFKTHFRNLHTYAFTIVKDDDTAEELVQQVFYKLWEKKDQVQIQQSITAYLYKAVYNECLNFVRHTKVKTAHRASAIHHNTGQTNAGDPAAIRELQQRIDSALTELPEQCRTIFQLSRFEELKYRDIAAKLGISVKTVENQMGKALRLLRLKLAEFLPVLLTIIINMKK